MAKDKPKQDGQEAKQPQFVIQRIYVKDVSFESPKSPVIFQKEWKPQVDIELNTISNQVSPEQHEVVLKIGVTAKIDDEVAFLAEVQQAGLFSITNFEVEQLKQMLGSYCPNILFPYVREAISDVVNRGGFPQFNLTPVNFDALYAQHLEQEKAQQAEGGKKAEEKAES